jgi:hypothetical protein
MSGPDGFLSRWSRRKLAVEREPDAAALSVESSPDAGIAPEAPGADEALSPEELAALPRLEDLTPGSDMTAFMRKGVPDLLRKAALRRMWSLDPAVRDYVGDARDYAWDWNVPGGVPGNGPLGPLDDLGASVGRMFSATRDPEATSATADGPDDVVVAEGHEAELELDSPEADVAAVALLPEGGDCDPMPVSEAAGEPVPGASPVSNRLETAELGPRAAPLRRHGAALPKFDLF